MKNDTIRQLNMIIWEITNNCNLHCPHCYNPINRTGLDELSTKECQTVIDSIGKIGTPMIGWTGGEPLLRKDLEDLIQYALHTYIIQSSITTNGTLLDRQRVESLKQAGLQSIQISLDGTTATRSRQIRRTTDEDFTNIINGIRLCREQGIDIYLAMLLGAENLDDGYKMVQLAKEEKVSGLRFCGFTPEGRSRNKIIQERFLFGNKLSELHKFIVEVNQDDTLLVMFDPGFGPIPPDYSFHECVAGKQTCYIKANGDVFPCTAMLYDQFIVGNVRKKQFDKLWYDKAMTSFNCQDKIVGICSNCDNFDNCHGACRSITYAHTGSFDESFPVCLYNISKDKNSKVISNS